MLQHWQRDRFTAAFCARDDQQRSAIDVLHQMINDATALFSAIAKRPCAPPCSACSLV